MAFKNYRSAYNEKPKFEEFHQVRNHADPKLPQNPYHSYQPDEKAEDRCAFCFHTRGSHFNDEVPYCGRCKRVLSSDFGRQPKLVKRLTA
jgi:hypothetical protein